ncbi:MAG: DUF4114 domain-containing protein, partial [Candidatus Cloacimonetes bacterium]|nr:DUF4114 domain-containing protein [Candidatus Cloacimonadota bacterium]
MKTLLKYMMLLSIIGLLVTGCSNKEDDTILAVQDLVVSDDFNWQASRQVELQLEVLNNHNNPVENIVFEIYNGDPSQAGEVIAKGLTEANGKFESFVNVPSSLTKIWAVGYMSTMELPIQNNRVAYTYGGAVSASKGGTDFAAPKSKAWAYLPGMTFNSQGVPAPMTSVPLEPDFLTRVNTTLPERYSVPQYHPHYLNPQNQTNIKIDEPAEVWITFVHEGAGNKNALGFHTYPSATVPQTTNDVGIKTILLPNASLVGSSGGMQAGDTMYLGIFNPGTTLGWFLVANGFQSGANVSTTAPIYYSNTHLNPEAAADDKQHSILVYDSISERLLIGFEDLNRTTGSDEDFNDLVFFVTVNPIEAVDMDGVPPMDEPGDRDNDGISDLFDDY